MALRPFRFGVSVPSATSRDDWRAKARRAEDLGFDVLLVADHLDAVFPPLAALCTAAEATTHLRVGTYVINNDFRHPVLLAREAAVVDLLTDGRLELGMGAGHMQWEYDQAGIPFDDAATRVARLGESLAIVRQLLDGGTVTFEGEHYRINGHRVFPRPQQPHLPLLVGGNGRRVLELAARHADIVSFTGFRPADGGRTSRLTHFTADGLASRIGVVQAAAPGRVDGLELNVLVQAVVDATTARAGAEAVAARTPGLSTDEAAASPFLLLGSADEMAEALMRRREALGISYITVFEAGMETVAPVIAQLRGC